jgi:alpha-L-rhamnosidase
MTNIAFHGEPEVATAYLSCGCCLAGKMARHLEKDDDAAFFFHAAEKAKEAYRYMFVEKGDHDYPRQCLYIRPIMLNLLSEEEKFVYASRLAQKLKDNGYQLNTGFLTTPELCRVLTEYGQAETAYRVLLQEDCPGWLYSVTKGATTIWESWDAINKDGEVSGSLNHYAYGAIAGWLFDSVCGIRLDRGQITVKPVPNALLGSAYAVYHSPFGVIESGWKYQKTDIVFSISIPCNVKVRIILPNGTDNEFRTGHYEFREKITEINYET